MNILLLGKNGQVGWKLQRSLSVLGPVTALGHDEADFTQPQAVAQAVRALRPQVIVNAAAVTDSEPLTYVNV
jgi:dTDP-4-dehydrorhamnose reductase